MQKTAEITISEQAKIMLEQMPNNNQDKFIEWYCNIRKVSIGGGDLIEYLAYIKKHPEELKN